MNTAEDTNQVQMEFCKLFKNHGEKIGFWSIWIELPATIVIQNAASMTAKATSRAYEVKGKNIGRANETTDYEQAVLELKSRVRKQQDKGYVASMEEARKPATNTLGLSLPMLATPLDKIKPEAIDWTDAYAQPKLDGHRALFKDGVLYSRQGKILDLPHIVEAIQAARIDGHHLDGELYLHGKTLQELSKLIKKHRPETLDLEYHIYDVVMDNAFNHRAVHMLNIMSHLSVDSPLKRVQTAVVSNMEELMERHADWRTQGYEGSMLRFGDEPYRTGKRSRTLVKLKEFQDAEFTIIGVEQGKPNIREDFTYEVPVWVCDAGNGKTFTVTAQGTMEDKHDLWVNRDECIGRNLTVKYHYLSDKGVPQLPVALRFRDDL